VTCSVKHNTTAVLLPFPMFLRLKMVEFGVDVTAASQVNSSHLAFECDVKMFNSVPHQMTFDGFFNCFLLMNGWRG